MNGKRVYPSLWWDWGQKFEHTAPHNCSIVKICQFYIINSSGFPSKSVQVQKRKNSSQSPVCPLSGGSINVCSLLCASVRTYMYAPYKGLKPVFSVGTGLDWTWLRRVHKWWGLTIHRYFTKYGQGEILPHHPFSFKCQMLRAFQVNLIHKPQVHFVKTTENRKECGPGSNVS